MTDKTRVRWFCPKCDVEHDLTDTTPNAVLMAARLLKAGIKMVALYDETYAVMCDLDRAEEALTGRANH